MALMGESPVRVLRFVCAAFCLDGRCGKPAPRWYVLDFDGVPWTLCRHHAVMHLRLVREVLDWPSAGSSGG